MSEGQGEIPLIGEMSAKQTKGSAVFAKEAASGEERFFCKLKGGCVTSPSLVVEINPFIIL